MNYLFIQSGAFSQDDQSWQDRVDHDAMDIQIPLTPRAHKGKQIPFSWMNPFAKPLIGGLIVNDEEKYTHPNEDGSGPVTATTTLTNSFKQLDPIFTAVVLSMDPTTCQYGFQAKLNVDAIQNGDPTQIRQADDIVLIPRQPIPTDLVLSGTKTLVVYKGVDDFNNRHKVWGGFGLNHASADLLLWVRQAHSDYEPIGTVSVNWTITPKFPQKSP